MTIKQRIDSDLKVALLAGEKDRATTLRGLKSTILNAEIASNAREQGLPDEQLIQILNKEVKKRDESVEMYLKGGSPERAEKELQEKVIITAYLPAQLGDEELDAIIKEAVSELQPAGIKDMGRVIANVKERVAGQAENARIAANIKHYLEKDHK